MMGRLLKMLGDKKSDNPVKEEMKKLIKDIWKYKYLYYKCNNPAITNRQYDEKIKKLKQLEDHYFEFCEPCTPTNRYGFHEEFAKQAYGDYWEVLKDSLDLLVKNKYDDYYNLHGGDYAGNGSVNDWGCP